MINNQPIEMHVIFKGKVQGVGFRYTVQKQAKSLGLTGTVCNLSDGAVEMFVQGRGQQLDQLIEKIKEEFPKESFEYMVVSANAPRKNYNSFEIIR